MSERDWADECTTYAAAKLAGCARQVVRCARLLGDTALWYRSNDHTNSVGNLVLHLTGNVRQWIVAGLGGKTFDRDRPAEFAARGPAPVEEVVASFERVVQDALEVLETLNAEQLLTRRRIQGYDVSGLVAMLHAMEHFSGHTGQIVHITKLLKDIDLSLYDDQGQRLAGEGP